MSSLYIKLNYYLKNSIDECMYLKFSIITIAFNRIKKIIRKYIKI